MGYIRLNRKILEWEWYTDKNTKILFIHCLLKANWKDGRFLGHDIPRGSFATSVNSLADETGLSIQQTRTALAHLQSTGEITIKTSSKYSVVTVVNYDLYQDDNKQDNKQSTCQDEDEQQTSNKQVTTIEKDKKDNNNKNINVQRDANEMFLRLWSMYPFRKSGKAAVRDATKRRLYSEVGEEQLIRCIERFKQDMSGRDPRYVVIGSTFFNTTYVDYLDENYKETMGITSTEALKTVNNGQLRRELQ